MKYIMPFNRDSHSRIKRLWSFRGVLISLLLLLLLDACEEKSFNITKIDASPEPVVGEVVTLSIKIESENEEPDVSLSVTLPEGVQLISGSTEWNGSLPANGTYTHDISICVLYEGLWHIRADARYWPTGRDERWGGDTDHLYLESTQNSGKVIQSGQYRPENETIDSTATPLPKLTIPGCPGQTEKNEVN